MLPCFGFDKQQHFKKAHSMINHLFNRNGFRPKRSITYSGMQKVGLIGFKVESTPSKDTAVKPNKVWNGSTMSPGLSLKPPLSTSWHESMNSSFKINNTKYHNQN